jgi:hypothetical protein
MSSIDDIADHADPRLGAVASEVHVVMLEPMR